MIIKIDDIEVTVRKKPIKNMHLYVQPPNGQVEISVPDYVNNDAIKLFIRSNLGWVKRKKKEFENQPRQTERQYISGETMYVLGCQYFLDVIENDTKKQSLTLEGRKAILLVKKDATIRTKEKIVQEWYRTILRKEIERVLPKWEKITNLKCTSWQIKKMNTKWGSCNPKTKKLWFNLQLAKKTLPCLDYIILHELIHLIEPHHNKKFIALMDLYMPTWQEIRDDLNMQILDPWKL